MQPLPSASAPSASGASGATSASDPNPPMSSAGPLTEYGKRKASEPQQSSSSSDNPSQPRKKWTDTGTQGDAKQDWTRFDLGRVLRTFRNASPGQCRLTLRKLHLRWWHAQAAPMQKLLKKAGAPDEIINMIPDIDDTCAACSTSFS